MITDLMGDDGGYGFSLPKTLKVVLRGRYLEGADLPVYSMTDHYFALCDGTDGFVEMFGGEYTARIGENTFEDDYLRIDNLREGEMSVTLRKNQPVWPEWTGTDTAQDVGGKKFVMIDGVWYNQETAPAVSETYAEDDAA